MNAEKEAAYKKLAQLSKEDPLVKIGVGFGSGLFEKCPGTIGTIAACPLVYCLSFTPIYIYLTLTAIIFLAGIKICNHIEKKINIHNSL